MREHDIDPRWLIWVLLRGTFNKVASNDLQHVKYFVDTVDLDSFSNALNGWLVGAQSLNYVMSMYLDSLKNAIHARSMLST
jgi:hypothetical protein